MEAYAEAPWSRGEPSNSARLFGPSDANMYSEVRDPYISPLQGYLARKKPPTPLGPLGP